MTENTANIGFEKEIWDAACILRGNMDAAEYKQVVLGLIFLKYISDKFEARYNELMAEDPDFAEDRDEYTSCNVFFVPVEARWAKIAEHIDERNHVNFAVCHKELGCRKINLLMLGYVKILCLNDVRNLVDGCGVDKY